MACDNQNVTTLDSFYVRHTDNYVNEAGSVALGEAIKTNTTLTELDLGSVLFICETYLKRTSVSSYSYSGNYVKTQGIATLGEALKVNTALTWLDLGGFLVKL